MKLITPIFILLLTLTSCKYEKQKTILNNLTTELQYIRKDIATAENKYLHNSHKKEELSRKLISIDHIRDTNPDVLKQKIAQVEAQLQKLETQHNGIVQSNKTYKLNHPIGE